MQKFKYQIVSVNEKERWIFLNADMWDNEETNAFISLVKMISDDLNGTIVDKGMTTYQIKNDPCRLTYQWDSLLGISIVYPNDISCEDVLVFLGRYL